MVKVAEEVLCTSARANILIVENSPHDVSGKIKSLGGRDDTVCYRTALFGLVDERRIHTVNTTAPDTLKGLGVEKFDGVIWGGSSFSVNERTLPVCQAIELLSKCIEYKIPCFGSCWGLQLAAMVLGGQVEKARRGPQVKVERSVSATQEGLTHPMLAGKPARFQVAQVHREEITVLPQHSAVLAKSPSTSVEAAVLRCDGWEIWGTQYHPEYSVRDLGVQLAFDGEKLIEEKAYPDSECLMNCIELYMYGSPSTLRHYLGIDSTLLETKLRCAEIRNWAGVIMRDRATS